MQITPLNGRIIVEPIAASTTTESGIIIPPTAKDTPTVGKVLHRAEEWISETGVTFKSSLQIGDTVIFGRYAGSEIELEGNSYIMLKESDLFGKLNS